MTPGQKSRTRQGVFVAGYGHVDSVRKLDSLYTHTALINRIEYTVDSQILRLGSPARFYKTYWKTLLKNFPKAIFLYLPVFSFILWLFHNKRRWWFFDHGIFTLHYFAFGCVCRFVQNPSLERHQLRNSFISN